MKPSQNGRGKGLESTTPNKNNKTKQNPLYTYRNGEKCEGKQNIDKRRI